MAAELEEEAVATSSPLPGQDNTHLAVDDNAVPQDDDDADSTIGLDNASETATLSSSIMAYRQENGRTYHAYRDGVYVLPNDEAENERLDLQHNLLLMTFDGLHCAPLEKPPRRVLDAGCGTGIWSIDFADEHPECQVTGIDLSPIQPPFVPPNISFYVDDLEDQWNFSIKFDFIFSRFMTGSIRNWPKYLKQCYDFLEPGGTLELMDIIYPLESDDGTLKEEHPSRKWSILLQEGFAGGGHPLNTALSYKDWLPDAGFVDVIEVKEKWPLNGWPKDPKYKQIGLWTHENGMQALEPLSLAIFTRPKNAGGLGWSIEELQLLLAGVRKDFKNTAIHSYWPVYSVYARKPQ